MTEAKPYQDTKKAWLTVLGAFMVHFISAGSEKAFSVWYIEIKDMFGSCSSTTSLINGISSAMRLILGPVAVMLIGIFGLQKVVIIGGLIASFGLFLCSMTENFYWLFFCYSFIYGFGLTLVFTPSLLVCTTYFMKRRSLALSISLTGAGFGSLFVPSMITYLIDQYSFDGAMLIHSAFTAHFCISGALYYSIEQPEQNPSSGEDKLIEATNDEKRSKYKMAVDKLKTQMSFGPVLRDSWFMLFASSFVFNMMGSGPVTTLIIEYSQTIGITNNQGVHLLAIEGIFQVFSRFLGGPFFDFERFRDIRGFLWCAIIFICSMIVCFIGLVNNYLGFMFLMAFRGLFLALYIAQQTLITADMADPDYVNQAIGLTQFMKGIGQATGSYISGGVRDLTGNFEPAFAFLGLMQTCGCMMALLPIYLRFSRRRLAAKRDTLGDQTCPGDEEQEISYCAPDKQQTTITSDLSMAMGSSLKDAKVVANGTGNQKVTT